MPRDTNQALTRCRALVGRRIRHRLGEPMPTAASLGCVADERRRPTSEYRAGPLPRSERARPQAGRAPELPLLEATRAGDDRPPLAVLLLLVLFNGLFVAAEFALVRSARGADRGHGRGRREGRRAGARRARPDRPLPRRLPARDHDGLARHRLPRRAGDRGTDRARRSRAARTGSPSAISHRDRLRDRDRPPHHRRRAGAEDGRDHQGRANLARCAGPLPASGRSARRSPWRPAKLSNAIVRLFGVDPERIEEQHTAEDVERDHPPSGDRRRHRGERGDDALRASSTCTSSRPVR